MLRRCRRVPSERTEGRNITTQISSEASARQLRSSRSESCQPSARAATTATRTAAIPSAPGTRPLVGPNFSARTSVTSAPVFTRFLSVAPTTLCWAGDEHLRTIRIADRRRGGRASTTSPRSDASLRRFLHGLPGVDQVGAEARGRDARHPLDQDHRQGVGHRPGDPDGRPDHARGRRTPPARSARCAAKAMRPDPADPTCPPVAAVCVYPDMVADRQARRSAAAACTSPPSPPRSRAAAPRSTSSSPTPGTPSRPAPTRSTWSSTAARSCPAATSTVFEEIVAVKEACGERPPQGDLRDRRAAHLRQRPPRLAGWRCWPAATSSRPPPARSQPAATLPVTLVMLEAVRDFRDADRPAWSA